MRAITVVALVVAVVVLLSWYNGSAAIRSLSEFSATAYGGLIESQISITIEISNSLPHGREFDIPEGHQPLTLMVRVSNSSLLPSRDIAVALRFSESVVDYLELDSVPGIVLNVGSLGPVSEYEHFELYSIPRFNGDPLAISQVAELLAAPVMVQAVVQRKQEHLLIFPTVNLALPVVSPPDAVNIDTWGDVILVSQSSGLGLSVRNSNTGAETMLSGYTGFFTSLGALVVVEEGGKVEIGRASCWERV